VRYSASAVLVASVLAMLGYKGINQPQATDMKFAYVNSNVVLEQAPGATEAQATFDREVARWQSEVQVLEDSLREMVSAYEQQQVMLSPEARTRRQQDIQQKTLEYQQRTGDLQQVAERRRMELIQPITEMITATIRDIRAEESYTMIFDAAAGALLAADTTLDITGVVIERIQQQSSAGGGTGN